MLDACFISIDCRTRVVKFNSLIEIVLEWKRGNSFPRDCIISCFKSCRIVSKGCLYHIVRVKDLEYDSSPIESVPIVRHLKKVFPDDLYKIPPEQEIDSCINLLPDTNPISISPYQMSPTELKEK